MIQPIKPSEIKYVIPDDIIQVVNTLIQNNWDGNEAVVKQKDILAQYTTTSKVKLSHSEIYEKNYLNFERLYVEAGWKVEYEKPERGETFESYFKFTVPKPETK